MGSLIAKARKKLEARQPNTTQKRYTYIKTPQVVISELLRILTQQKSSLCFPPAFLQNKASLPYVTTPLVQTNFHLFQNIVMARYIHTLIQRIASWFTGNLGINMFDTNPNTQYTLVPCREQKQVSIHDRYKHSSLQRQYPQV